MASSERISEMMTSASDWLNDQQWFQELRGKWEELDPQSRVYLKMGSLVLLVCVLAYGLVSSLLSVNAQKREIAEKTDLLRTIQLSNDELRKLRDVTGGAANAAADPGPWGAYFDHVIEAAGIDKGAFEVGGEKPGAANDQTKESLFELNLKHVNIKQIVKFTNALEAGSRPVKLRNLTVDTKNDPAGYMDAKLFVSAFKLVTQ